MILKLDRAAWDAWHSSVLNYFDNQGSDFFGTGCNMINTEQQFLCTM